MLNNELDARYHCFYNTFLNISYGLQYTCTSCYEKEVTLFKNTFKEEVIDFSKPQMTLSANSVNIFESQQLMKRVAERKS